jgi:hypothetical protein
VLDERLSGENVERFSWKSNGGPSGRDDYGCAWHGMMVESRRITFAASPMSGTI